MSQLPTNRTDEIKIWLNTIETNNFQAVDDEDSCSSIVDTSVIETSSSSESGEDLELGGRIHSQTTKYDNILPSMTEISFNNVNITNSTNIYLGHIYKVNGNLNINVIQSQGDDTSVGKNVPNQKKQAVVRPACLIYPRYRWLAMDPLVESKQVLEPVEFVIIGHTATTSSTVQARNIGIIRDLQTLNVEAQGFNDIIYNFLIGCDGVVYEGRGWAVQGDHTTGYNSKSIGIAFVGNFKRDRPAERALKACKNLLARGVSERHLAEDYKLLTSCQCSANANIDALYEEFKKWDNFLDIQKSLQ